MAQAKTQTQPRRTYSGMLLRTKMVVTDEREIPFAESSQTIGEYIDAYIADAENNGANLLSVTLLVPQED
jgi:hypothetical protein